LGLTANSLLRGIAGFLIFMLAFGLRRSHAALWWYGLALGASGIGALVGLSLVPRLRRYMREPQMLLVALVAVCLGAVGAAYVGGLPVQIVLAFLVGVAGAVGQPSFDAMTQRLVPVAAQGRAFARFATRQQLVWVLGALIPVAIALPLVGGDIVIAVIAGGGALFYLIGRRTRVVAVREQRHRDDLGWQEPA
jgi:MFS family permease